MTCPQCKGHGRYTSREASGAICRTCDGTGEVTAGEAKTYGDRVDHEMRDFLKQTARRSTRR